MKRFIFLLVVFVFSFRQNMAAEQPEPVYSEFHYDRVYPDSYRVIAAFRFAGVPELSAASRETIKTLVFNGLDYGDYAESVMRNWGSRFIDKGEYRFDFGVDFWSDPEWEKLRDERRPRNAEYPAFECLISFEAFEIVFASDEFVVFRRDWETNPSDAAHGNYGVDYRTVDIKNKTIPELDGLLPPRSVENLEPRVRTLLDEQKIQTEWLYPDKLPGADSFVFEKTGLRLVWEPYSIASFAEGVVSVLLPYPEIEKHLTADGRRLMRAFAAGF